MMTDPVADMLTRIRNAVMAKHARTRMPASRIKMEIARILKEAGYIDDYKKESIDEKPVITLKLRYGPDGEKVITGIRKASRSGLRLYAKKGDIPVVLGGLGINIVSTSQGLMTGSECRRRGLGGEILCTVW